jgi:hypothetical protein
MAIEAFGVAPASKPAAAFRTAKELARVRTPWKSKTQLLLEKNVRDKKLAALYLLQDRMRVLTGRIEILEDELDVLGWKPRTFRGAYKTPYREELINELCALPEKERAQRIRDLAAQEGIDRRSVYRKLQKCGRWSLRRRENPALGTKCDAVLNKRAAVSDVG